VEGVHDLHIWMITSDFSVMTVHLKVNPEADRDLILEKAKQSIGKQFGIRHVTIQTEGRELCLCDESCN
ncbi:hypothetical protein KWH76_22120, partial [Enterobacter roggenkampii]|nr:hypothetical protein [Enterobacter roggenkampii]